jgi:hypothetical protein
MGLRRIRRGAELAMNDGMELGCLIVGGEEGGIGSTRRMRIECVVVIIIIVGSVGVLRARQLRARTASTSNRICRGRRDVRGISFVHLALLVVAILSAGKRVVGFVHSAFEYIPPPFPG